MTKFNKLAVAAALSLGAAAAQAQTAQTTFTVSADVQESCSVAATDLVFGNYLATAGRSARYDEHDHGHLPTRPMVSTSARRRWREPWPGRAVT
jgi:hypothetical protein